jgi:CRISPR-associated endoribonuclease Cas6
MVPETFDLRAITFRFIARGPIAFDACGSGNWLRGAFGGALREVACLPDCPGRAGLPIAGCSHSAVCTYAQVFEPRSVKGPSGLSDPPRPFVFRVAHLANRSLGCGGEFSVQMNFFDPRRDDFDPFARAFSRLARAELIAASSTLFSLSLAAVPDRQERICIQFRSPTELSGRNANSPFDFSTVFARARDRVSTLRALYGQGPLGIDFRALGDRARAIRTARSDLHRVRQERRSGRTGQVHDIGGFIGTAEYEGPVAEFLPILRAARWTGIGRHCVWGNGEIAIVTR